MQSIYSDPNFVKSDPRLKGRVVPPLVREMERDPFLTPGEVTEIFGVDLKTVVRWAKSGKLGKEWVDFIRTPGGHRRYRSSLIERLIKQGETKANPRVQKEFVHYREQAKKIVPDQRVSDE